MLTNQDISTCLQTTSPRAGWPAIPPRARPAHAWQHVPVGVLPPPSPTPPALLADAPPPAPPRRRAPASRPEHRGPPVPAAPHPRSNPVAHAPAHSSVAPALSA
ncbi:arabinogalactan protein 1-like [Miscanthus floridulus]|uniref:arabinogalactan protein 1-like n=1 Tax=Miscanthus floridulus TaxID=154761 RepID=UPI003457F689